MYTATIQNKTIENGVLKVTVTFSDGNNFLTEWCIPQDEGGLKHWVKSRLTTLNSGKEIDAKYSVNDVIDTSDAVVTPIVQTPEEIARDKWFKKYNKWVKIKTTLIDTGILTGDEANLVTLKGKVQSDYLPEYLDLL